MRGKPWHLFMLILILIEVSGDSTDNTEPTTTEVVATTATTTEQNDSNSTASIEPTTTEVAANATTNAATTSTADTTTISTTQADTTSDEDGTTTLPESSKEDNSNEITENSVTEKIITETTSSRISTTLVSNEYFVGNNTTDCQSKEVTMKETLNFGISIKAKGNLTWSGDNLNNIHCVSEFVVMYRDVKDPTASASVLCPGYQVRHLGEDKFGCEYELPDHKCGKQLEILLEAWTFTNLMIQPTAQVGVNCGLADFLQELARDVIKDKDAPESKESQDDTSFENEFEPQSNDSDKKWHLPLVLASINFFKDAANNTDSKRTSNTKKCQWSSWTSWSGCSVTCGGKGTRTRQRTQEGSSKCTKSEEDSQDCITNLCAVDCSYGPWGEWSSCSMSCGHGVRTRSRLLAQQGKYGGRICKKDTDSEQEDCLDNDCPVDGSWSTWSRWGYCSRTCGIGSRERIRTCTEPEPQFGGKKCAGAGTESKQCFRQDCPPVDGGWSSWGRWSPCSQTCGRGQQRRVRSCTAPLPSGGGRMCTGDSTEINTCILRNCEGPPEPIQEYNLRFNPYKSRLHSRITSRLTTTTPKDDVVSETEIPATGRINEDLGDCDDVPHVLDLMDPERLSDGRVKYTCSKGLVVDIRTNRRHQVFPCDRISELNTTILAKCQAPTHCVGPAPKPELDDNAYLPLPRRDVPVNTNTRYTCKDGGFDFVSCFYDGKYRKNEELCSSNSSALNFCSSSETERSIMLKSGDSGSISGPTYPYLSSGETGCTWTLTAPPHFGIAVGIEDIRSDSGLHITFLQLSEYFWGEEKTSDLSPFHVGNVWRSVNNTITLRFLKKSFSTTFRLSYIVIDHVNHNKYKPVL